MISKHLYILSGMKSVHERVAHAITKSGNTASSVARRLGCSPEAVLQWMNGATKNIRPVNLFALADLTGHSARWLATGEGPQIDAYQNEVIQHVVRAMEHMPPSEQSKFARMADAFIGSPTNDAEIRGGNERSMGS